jgi:DNA-binding response OmpR family regulator
MERAKARILIADDEPAVATLLAEALDTAGYSSSVVGDGREALRRADSGAFELVILDLGLPGLSGLEVLQSLRARGCSVPVLILTAMSSPADKVTGLYAGADDYLTKPFDLGEVIARVRARLRDHYGSESG